MKVKVLNTIKDENYQAKTINLQTNNRVIAHSLESIKNEWLALSRTSTAPRRRRANTKVQLSCQGKECTGENFDKMLFTYFPSRRERGKRWKQDIERIFHFSIGNPPVTFLYPEHATNLTQFAHKLRINGMQAR